jgi:hypothetical protein
MVGIIGRFIADIATAQRFSLTCFLKFQGLPTR